MPTPPDDFNPLHPSPRDLVWAYSHGYFPMADPDDPAELFWFRPDPRTIIPLDAAHIPRSLAREVRRNRLDIRCDTAFDRVMRGCAAPRADADRSWIDDRLIACYTALFHAGHAHSIEAFLDGRLVGGLYGVHINSAFFGESMFSRPDLGGTNASKICFVHLINWLNHRGFELLDSQYANDHMQQFGCVDIPDRQYIARLQKAIAAPLPWGHFHLLSSPLK